MASPRLEAAAASTRRPQDVLEARAAKPLNMFQVMQAGAAAAVAADPKPLAQSSTMALIDALVDEMPAFPHPQPRLPRSPYINCLGQITDVSANIRWEREQREGQHQPPAAPCSTPNLIPSMGYTQTCRCGWAMGAHKTGGAK